jgi:hypothetical protein
MAEERPDELQWYELLKEALTAADQYPPIELSDELFEWYFFDKK